MKKVWSFIIAGSLVWFGSSCKTSQKSVQVTDSDYVMGNYDFPLADTAMKYTSANAILTEEMTDQVKEIMPNLYGKATVMQFGEGIVVSLDRGNIFGVNDFLLNENSKDIIRHLGFNLTENPDTYILVVGRTDATGPAEYNQNLAYRRACAVANYLVGCGINKDRMFVDTFGEKFPDFSNNRAFSRNLNRRVDFLILPSNYMRRTADTK